MYMYIYIIIYLYINIYIYKYIYIYICIFIDSEKTMDEVLSDNAHLMFDTIPVEVPITIEIYYPLGYNNLNNRGGRPGVSNNFEKKFQKDLNTNNNLDVKENVNSGSFDSEGDVGGGIHVGEGSTHVLKMLKDDLYHIVINAKHLLHIALRAVYTGFYYNALVDETQAVEQVNLYICTYIYVYIYFFYIFVYIYIYIYKYICIFLYGFLL
jgi:hypothetical protein